MSAVAIGIDDVEDLHEFIEYMIDGRRFNDAYENAVAPTVEEAKALLVAVVAEHDRRIRAVSGDVIHFSAAKAVLAAKGVALTLDRLNDEYAAEDGLEHARLLKKETGVEAQGFVYCTHQDLQRAVLHGELRVGFGATTDDTEDVLAVGRLAAEVFETIGLPVAERLPAPYRDTAPDDAIEPWVGDPGERFVVRPFRWEMPFGDEANDGDDGDASGQGADRQVRLTDRHGATQEDVSVEAFAVQFYALLERDDPKHSFVKVSDSDGWRLEFNARSVSFDRVDPDEHIGTHIFSDNAEACTIATDFIFGDFDAIRALPWVS